MFYVHLFNINNFKASYIIKVHSILLITYWILVLVLVQNQFICWPASNFDELRYEPKDTWPVVASPIRAVPYQGGWQRLLIIGLYLTALRTLILLATNTQTSMQLNIIYVNRSTLNCNIIFQRIFHIKHNINIL